MEEKMELENRQYFTEIFDKLLIAIKDEIRADYEQRKKINKDQIKNQGDYADLLHLSESTVKKLMGNTVKNDSLVNIVDLLTICDKLNIPIKFNYEIGLHTCRYENKGTENQRRNINSERYKINDDNFVPKEELLKRWKDYAPSFANYEPKIIEFGINGVPTKVNCDTDDEESINLALGLEKSLKEFLEDVESDDSEEDSK